jgi:hypothetical protein
VVTQIWAIPELLEGFEHGEAGEPDPALGATVLAQVGFPLNEPGQILDRGPAVLGGFFSEGF